MLVGEIDPFGLCKAEMTMFRGRCVYGVHTFGRQVGAFVASVFCVGQPSEPGILLHGGVAFPERRISPLPRNICASIVSALLVSYQVVQTSLLRQFTCVVVRR